MRFTQRIVSDCTVIRSLFTYLGCATMMPVNLSDKWHQFELLSNIVDTIHY